MKRHGLYLPWEVDERENVDLVRVISSVKGNGKRDIVCLFPMMQPPKTSRRYAEAIVASANAFQTATLLGDRLWREMTNMKTRTFSRELWKVADELRNLTE